VFYYFKTHIHKFLRRKINMAYKFQRGTAKLSGSITLEDNLQVDGTINLANGSLALAELDIDGGTDIGADLVDADLIIIDDGAAGANRKGALLRVKKYIYAAMSGDATASDAGALTIANDAVESGMLNDNVISGQSALGSASAAQADELLFSDGGVLKKVTFSNLEDSIFGNVSGQAAVAAGGALSLGVSAITAQTNMTGDVADADELMINDGGVLKRVDFSVFRDAIFKDVSGDATMADGGAITIAANAIQTGMVHDDVATELASGNGLAASAGVMSVNVSGAIAIGSDTLGIPSSAIGKGLSTSGPAAHIKTISVKADPSSFGLSDGEGLILSSSVAGAGIALELGVLSVDIDELSALGGTGVAQGDHFVFSDGGTEKKITASNLEDWMFGNVSGDATIAAGGALTIGAATIEHAMLAEDIISGQGALTASLAATDELMISDAGAIKRMDVSVLGDFFAGAGLTASSGVLAVKCDNSSVEVTDSGDTVRVKALGVTNAMLAGSIANAKLSNSSVSFGGISLALGASDATPAFNLSDATAYTGDSALVTAGALNGGSITSGFGSIDNGSSAITSTGTGSFGCVVISGNLTVSGQTTTVNSEIVNIADHNIVLDSNNGTSAVIDGAGITIEGGSGDDVTFQWLAGSTRMELKKGTDFGDFKMGVLTGVDGAFSGDVSCKGVQETMQTHTEAATLSFAQGAIVKCTAGVADYTLTLPAASGNSGRIFKIKRADAATYVITLDANGAETIDGYQTIGLESDYAGLSLICDGSNWLIL
jgi:hypothetical protein